jgi:3-mercaptopyruvate sulfurtransferase SseA
MPIAAERVQELAGQLGLAPDDALVVTCHAGHRAAITARVLRAAGFRRVRVSLGSWHEWALRGLADEQDPA